MVTAGIYVMCIQFLHSIWCSYGIHGSFPTPSLQLASGAVPPHMHLKELRYRLLLELCISTGPLTWSQQSDYMHTAPDDAQAYWHQSCHCWSLIGQSLAAALVHKVVVLDQPGIAFINQPAYGNQQSMTQPVQPTVV